MTKRLLSITGVLLTALAFSACEIALGSMINMKGPVLAVSAPVSGPELADIAVKDIFELKGSAKSENAVAGMEVRMMRYDSVSKQLIPMGREWSFNKVWSYRQDSGEPWKTYTEADYGISVHKPNVPLSPPAWSVRGNTVHWNLPILLTGLDVGDYFITINTWDAAGRRDSNSSRKIKVNFDDDMPRLKIRSPELLIDDSGGPQMYPNIPAQFGGYIYDPLNRPDETFEFIKRWVNAPVSLSYEIAKEMLPGHDGLPYRLSIELTNQHHLDSPQPDEKELYYRYEWNDPAKGNPPAYGVLTGTGESGDLVNGFTNIGGAMDIVPRDPGTGEPNGAVLPRDRISYIQVVTRLEGAGNRELKSQGWFAWFPDSDKPWVNIKFGKKTDPAASIPANTPDIASIWTSQTYSGNDAFDNEGVASITWRLYKLKETGLDPVDAGSKGSLEDPWTRTIRFPAPREKQSWSFTADAAYGVGRFKIEVQATDVNGLAGDFYEAWFTIDSNTTPTLRELEKPELNGDTLFGDPSGDFVISGLAQIDDESYDSQTNTPGIKVDRVSVVWIKPGSAMADSRLLYQDRNYAEWDKGKYAPTASGYYQDRSGNRVWELPAPVFVGRNEHKQYDWRFSKTLNLFRDLDFGPGKIPSGAQNFLIRIWTAGTTQPRSSVSSFATFGDSTPPVLTAERIIVSRYRGPGFYEEQVYDYPFAMLAALNENDKIKIQGSWTDDSFAAWTGIPGNGVAYTRGDLFSGFRVNWSGENLSRDLDNCRFYEDRRLGLGPPDSGNWESGELIFSAKNTDPIVTVSVSLTDLNNNTGICSETLIVETDNPTLIRISSDTSDGIYGEKKNTQPKLDGGPYHYIDIFLEFNKQVQFFDGGQNDTIPAGKTGPYLNLNNGGRAYYLGGNGSNKIYFRYFVDGVIAPPLPGALSGHGGVSTPGKLNVNDPNPALGAIAWNDYPQSEWVGAGNKSPVLFPDSVFAPDSPLSLPGGKNIVIDKQAPRISGIVTSAGSARPHGSGSPIYITVNFDKDIALSGAVSGTRDAPGNLYLKLAGGNLAFRDAKALFSNVAGASSVSFRYDVLRRPGEITGDDTSAYSEHLYIASLYMGAGLDISDMAGNLFSDTALPNSGLLDRPIVIDTNPPAVPLITGLEPRSYYSEQTFGITGLESRDVTVEYSLNYDPDRSEEANWTSVPLSKYPITPEPGKDSYAVSGIPLSINGQYRIAARQYDNATRANVSANPGVAQTVGTASNPVIIDKGALFTRLGSSTPNGIYGYKGEPGQKISIDLFFRNPVYLPEISDNADTSKAYALLNIADSNGGFRKAVLPSASSHSADYRTWTFSYTVQEGDSVEVLDVTGINWGGLRFFDSDKLDAAGQPAGTELNGWMALDANNANHQFRTQKNISIMSGFPAVVKTGSVGSKRLIDGAAEDTANDIGFYSGADGSVLDIRFDRNIYRGDTRSPLVFRQLKTDYRIPVVLSPLQWEYLFLGRADPVLDTAVYNAIGNSPAWTSWSAANAGKTRTDFWRWAGEQFYVKGSNGAFETSPVRLQSDTGVKYVLDYRVDPLNVATGISTGIAGLPLLKVGSVADIFRYAEELSFNVRDNEVSIVNDGKGMPRILRIDLTGKNLPVKGAKYQWIFPNGFVKDFLEKYNGNSSSGIDGLLSSGNPDLTLDDANERTLKAYGVEAPVIRVNKGGDRVLITGIHTPEGAPASPSGVNRQAIQPLTTGVKIDCRTPASTLTYKIRETTDPVGRLVLRSDPGNVPRRLPNLGNQKLGDYASYSAVAGRPQSGALPAIDTNGLNFWTGMGAWTGTYRLYPRAGLSIGKSDYNAGGMEINIQAQASVNGSPPVSSFEAAYRSVLVFQNTALNTNKQVLDIGDVFSANAKLGRIWIRGGDATSGIPSTPDFPLSRDRSLWKKNRLLTPFPSAGYTANKELTNKDIPSTYNSKGQYLWFWVSWALNVNAYVDLFAGQLPASGDTQVLQAPRNSADFLGDWIRAKEHYPVIPGRTTVVETRHMGSYVDGGHGMIQIGALLDVPDRRD